MKHRIRSAALIPLLLLASASGVHAQSEPFLRFRVETWLGASNAPGYRRITDQFWAAQSSFTPSMASATYGDGKGRTAKVGLGFGEATLGRDRFMPQPVEAWVRDASGATTVTVGRFFAPFGVQEWQYEPRDGVQVEAPWAGGSAALAIQGSKDRRTSGYFRYGRDVAKGWNVGVSAAAGAGFSYGSRQDRGYGVDVTGATGRVSTLIEADRFTGAGTAFRFAMARVVYAVDPRWSPFVSTYRWRETGSDVLGSWKSTMAGVAFKIAEGLDVEAAVSRAAGRDVRWFQIHWAWER
ncbi:MAG: hypothetical protein ACKO5K_11915 [Armatimonadota bacterium]